MNLLRPLDPFPLFRPGTKLSAHPIDDRLRFDPICTLLSTAATAAQSVERKCNKLIYERERALFADHQRTSPHSVKPVPDSGDN